MQLPLLVTLLSILLSVSGLTHQVDEVRFTRRKASVMSRIGGEEIVTPVGRVTKANLYDFDIDAFQDHQERVAVEASAG